MCGLLGAYPACRLDYENLLHRGPDHQAIEALGDVVFAHTRLSILDLSDRANQPIRSSRGDVLLTYNGEIYNYTRLHSSATSDSRALVDWLEDEGSSFDPGFLDGMYAFAAYFVSEERLVLCRDVAGIKPLYIAFDERSTSLAFSSEIKGLYGVEWFSPRLSEDPEVQGQYLQYGYALPRVTRLVFRGEANEIWLVPTLLKNVYQLPPAQKLILQMNSRRNKLTSRTTRLKPSYIGTREALSMCVEDQSISDVDVGVQLSGGIDSSLVAHFYAMQQKRVHGFYVSVDSRFANEDEYAGQAAETLEKMCDFKFHEISLGESDVREDLPAVVWYGDEPVIRHPNSFGIFKLCRHVKETTNIKVLLTGEGADEIFGGYPWHDGKVVSGYDKSRRIFDIQDFGVDDWFNTVNQGTILERQLAFDKEFYLPPILARQDRMSMASSIESRVPFLSNRFLQADSPVKPGKSDLKKESEMIFGKEFTHRKKVGFGLPWEWFGGFKVDQELTDWLKIRPKVRNCQQQWTYNAIGLWTLHYIYNGYERGETISRVSNQRWNKIVVRENVKNQYRRVESLLSR